MGNTRSSTAFEAAARDGFRAVEFLFPYEFDVRESAHGSTLTDSRRRSSMRRLATGKKASVVLHRCRDAKRNSKRAFGARWNTLPCSETSVCT